MKYPDSSSHSYMLNWKEFYTLERNLMLLTIIALSNDNYCIKIVRLFVNKLQMYKVVLRLHFGVHT